MRPMYEQGIGRGNAALDCAHPEFPQPDAIFVEPHSEVMAPEDLDQVPCSASIRSGVSQRHATMLGRWQQSQLFTIGGVFL